MVAWYILLPAPALAPSQNKAPGWWRLVVVGLGDSSGGCSFTTHCAAGLSLDAGVIPQAAGEMSCLLPFPYTPKPNEQSGARPPASTQSSLLLQSVSSYIRFLPSCPSWLHRSSTLWSMSSSSPIFLLVPPSIHPSNHPFILLCFHGAYALSSSAPHHYLTTQRRAANDLARPQRLRSELSLSHGIYTHSHTFRQMGAPQWHVHAHHIHICTCV